MAQGHVAVIDEELGVFAQGEPAEFAALLELAVLGHALPLLHGEEESHAQAARGVVVDLRELDIVWGGTHPAPGSGFPEPFAFSRAPVTEPEPAPAEPLATDGASPGTRWPEIQAMFVDDPRACVQLATGLLDESVGALVVSLKERHHSLLRAWQGEGAGTEELRTTVQQYRTFWNRLEDFSREV